METPTATPTPVQPAAPIASPSAPVESAPVQSEAKTLSPTETLVESYKASKEKKEQVIEKGSQEPSPAPDASAGVDKKEEKKWDGNFANLEALPAELHDKAKELQRKWTELTTQNSDAVKKAQAFDQIANDPDLEAFRQWKASKDATPKVEIAPGIEVPQDLAEAALTDPNALVTLVQTAVKSTVESAQKKAKEEARQAENETKIASFANKTTDFWDLYDQFEDNIKGQLRQGRSIEEAYGHVKGLVEGIQTKAREQERETLQQRVTEKRNSVTLLPSSRQESDVIWVENQSESRRIAMEYAEKFPGKRMDIRIKPKTNKR